MCVCVCRSGHAPVPPRPPQLFVTLPKDGCLALSGEEQRVFAERDQINVKEAVAEYMRGGGNLKSFYAIHTLK